MLSNVVVAVVGIATAAVLFSPKTGHAVRM